LRAAADIVDIVDPYDNVDVFGPRTPKRRTLWEPATSSRHLQAYLGLQVNEDVVIR
jgi:hypothetical protein